MAKITIPDKATGQTLAATEFNQVKAAVNAAYDEIGNKVTKVTGEGLTPEKYTLAEKQKLAGLETSKFKGVYTTLTALQTAYATAEAGSWAYVDAGSGNPIQTYVYDVTDTSWELQAGDTTAETPASVLSKLLSNPDTNILTDAEQAKLASLTKDYNELDNLPNTLADIDASSTVIPFSATITTAYNVLKPHITVTGVNAAITSFNVTGVPLNRGGFITLQLLTGGGDFAPGSGRFLHMRGTDMPTGEGEEIILTYLQTPKGLNFFLENGTTGV